MARCRITNWSCVERTLNEYYGSVDAGLSEVGISGSVKYGYHELNIYEMLSLQNAIDWKGRCIDC